MPLVSWRTGDDRLFPTSTAGTASGGQNKPARILSGLRGSTLLEHLSDAYNALTPHTHFDVAHTCWEWGMGPLGALFKFVTYSREGSL